MSDGGTEKGRPVPCWITGFKLVGGRGRQIHLFVNAEKRRGVLLEHKLVDPMLPRKASKRVILPTVPQTDTGRQGEYPKALERTLVKELCKMTP